MTRSIHGLRLAQSCCSRGCLGGRPGNAGRGQGDGGQGGRISEVGRTGKAFPEFDAKDGPWHDRDLYVTVQDNKGVMVAHGTNPGLIGKSMLDLKDVDGKAFNREIHGDQGTGWVNFKWQIL